MSLEELYKLKIIALLHDPPNKPFELKRHREVAEEVMRDIIGSEIGKLAQGARIHLSDRIASSFDRWILSILMGDKWIPGLFGVEIVKIKNIVAPSLEEEVPRPNESSYMNYISELKDILSIADEWRLKYHLLYLFYEPLWILNDLPLGPADTRVPTHTVFDHDYATASIINWTFEDSKHVRGLLVGLDVAGVQRFVSSSRKVRDGWISSYIVSALTWYAVIELISKLGPDILLMPSPRMNVFYLYWLKHELIYRNMKSYGSLDKYLEQLETLFYVSNSVFKMYEELGIPPYPIIPGRATLILPSKDYLEKDPLNIKDLKKYFEDRFENGWKLLWGITRKLAEKLEGEDSIWRFIKKVFDYYDKVLKDKDRGFNNIPPLGLRIEYVEIDSSDDENLWYLYDKKYRELVNRLSLAKYRCEYPETKLKLYGITEQLFENGALGIPKPSSRGFEYCTCCGRMPAIVVLPRESERPEEDEYEILLYCTVVKNVDPQTCNEILKNESERKKLIDEYKEQRINIINIIERFKSIFSPGERLCPWCFLKRALSLEPRVLKILLIGDESKIDDVIDGILKEKKETWFPSTAHIASTRLYEKMADLEFDKLREFVQKIINLIHYKPSPRTWTWLFMEGVYKKLDERIKSSSVTKEDVELTRTLIQALIQSDPEDHWFNPSKRSEWSEVLRAFGLSKWCWRYYVLMRADGDSIGDLLEGKLTAFLSGRIDEHIYDKILAKRYVENKEFEELGLHLGEYITSACEGDLRDFMKFCLSALQKGLDAEDIKEKGRGWVQRISEEGKVSIDEAHKRISNVIDLLRGIIKVPRLIVSPSYHVAISGALMRIAMLDIAMISELDGIVVYSGGDDLMAFVPVDKALDIVYNTRRGFSGASIGSGIRSDRSKISLRHGFLKIKNANLSLLPNVGRSYCVYIVHYHYPLSVVITRSLELLEEAKSSYTVEYFDDYLKYFTRVEKDMVTIAYNPRSGGEEYTLIPLTLKRPIISLSPLNDGRCSKESSIDAVAQSLTLVNKLFESIDERVSGEGRAKISKSLLYDAKHFIDTLTMLIKKSKENTFKAEEFADTSLKLLQGIIRRNINTRFKAEAENLCKNLLGLSKRYIPLLSLIEKKNGEVLYPAILSALDSVRLIISGMR